MRNLKRERKRRRRKNEMNIRFRRSLSAEAQTRFPCDESLGCAAAKAPRASAITTNKARSSGDPLIRYFNASTIVETLCFIIPSYVLASPEPRPSG